MSTEHFAIDFQELKAEDMKQQVEFLENENNRLRMKSDSMLKAIEFLSV